MELRATITSLEAVCKYGNRIESYYRDLEAEIGYYSDYIQIGEKEYKAEDYVDENRFIVTGERLPIITLDDCKAFVNGEPIESIIFALETNNIKLQNVEDFVFYYKHYEHHVLCEDSATALLNTSCIVL